MRVHCFSTGAVRLKAGERGLRRYLADDWMAETLPVNVFAIEHPAGICLFDTGQTAEANRHGYFPSWYPFFRLSRFELGPEDEAAAQLERVGLLESVRWVVLSHLHTDHVGGVARFAGADIIVSRQEWVRAQGLGGRIRGYLPQWWPTGLIPRVVDLDGPPIGPFATSLDLAGDGALVLVPTSGHTPGHISLIARDDDAFYFCAGDLAQSFEELERRRPDIAEYCRREGVVLLATHDPNASNPRNAGK